MRVRAIALAVAAIGLATSAQAADLLRMQPAPAYNAAAFNFNGFYLGAQGGGTFGSASIGSLGVVAGSNFDISDPIIAGIEFQGDYLFNGSASYDFYALGRLGVVVTNNLLAYGELGTGWVGGTTNYAFGGGLEYALTDTLSIKGEALGTGAWGASPSATRIQAGLLFHLQ